VGFNRGANGPRLRRSQWMLGRAKGVEIAVDLLLFTRLIFFRISAFYLTLIFCSKNACDAQDY